MCQHFALAKCCEPEKADRLFRKLVPLLAVQTICVVRGCRCSGRWGPDPEASILGHSYFVDCLSFVIMSRIGCNKAFTFDSHFGQMGFEMLPAVPRQRR